MTPLAIEIMLNYATRASDYRSVGTVGDTPPAVAETLAFLEERGLLARSGDLQRFPLFLITEGGKVYVEALKAAPLPVQRWVMPEKAGGLS